MTKTEKLQALSIAMERSKRDGERENSYREYYYHFTDVSPEELKDLFLTHYEVRDVDYETFDRAIDIVREVYADKPEATDDEATEDIYERASDSASVYTAERLAYLDIWNEEEVSQKMREYGEHSIATACALWYDSQVEQAAIIIKDWVNA